MRATRPIMSDERISIASLNNRRSLQTLLKHILITMKFTATAVVVAIAASFGIKPVRGDSLFDGKSPKRSPSSGGSVDEYSYTESTNFAGTYTQCSVSVIHSSASGDLDDTYRDCADENSSPVVFTITKTTGDGYGAYKATTMPPEFVSDDFVMGGWQGFANGNTLRMSSFGAAVFSMFPVRAAQPVLYNDSPNTMICSAFKFGVLQCMADIPEYCSKVSGEGVLLPVPYCEDREGKWLNTYSMKSVFVREGFDCPPTPPDYCESLPLPRNPITEDTVAEECGGSYSGDIVVRLEDDLECSVGNTISGPDAAFTLTNGATLDCEGHELSMGDDVDIRYGIKMFNTATVRNCNVSKFSFANAFIKSQSGTTTIADSTLSGSNYGVWVQQEYSQEGNVVVLENVNASFNSGYGGDGYGIYSPGEGGSSHKIKLEGSVIANENGNDYFGGAGIGLAGYNNVEVFGQVDLSNNLQYGLLLFYLSSGDVTLIGADATLTACGNTKSYPSADIASFSSGAQVTPSYPDGEYRCDNVYNGEFGTLPANLCDPCTSTP